MKTKNGIELNLCESDYKYVFSEYTFYFSSEFYLRKFKRDLLTFILSETRKLSIKYGIDINLNDYLAISLYKKIEKRGFYVEKQGKELTDEIEFEGYIL